MIQTYLQPDVATDSRVADIVDEITERMSRGEEVDIEEYAERYPSIAAMLQRVIETLHLLREPALNHLVSEAPPDSDFQIIGQLGDFRILHEIGRGGMGIVYEAEQVSLGRRVALKVLPFASVLDPKQLQRFKNEAQAAAVLDHPNIVHVYSVGCERGVHYYAMQYIEGHSLTELINQLHQLSEPAVDKRGKEAASSVSQMAHDMTTGCLGVQAPTPRVEGSVNSQPTASSTVTDAEQQTLPDVEAILSSSGGSIRSREFFHAAARLGIQAAEALEHAHQMGVVHRDIKPSNLLVDSQGHLWVTDFGLAMTQTRPNLTLTGDVLGTLRYMSPEQASGKSHVLDHHTDIYSLGLTLYELLTLEPAFGGDDRQTLLRQVLEDDPRPPRQINAAIPKDLETIVLKATAKDRHSRYATARELADDLQRFLDNKPIRAKRPSLSDRMAKWSRRHKPFVWAAGLISFTVMVAAIVLAIKREHSIADVEQHLAAGKALYQAADYADAEKELTEASLCFQGVLLSPKPLKTRLQVLIQKVEVNREAQQRFQKFQDFRNEVYANIYNNTQETLDQVLKDCRAALDLYGLFSVDNLEGNTAFVLLEVSQQAILREAIAELLFVLAETELSREQEPQTVEDCLKRSIAVLKRIERFYHPIPGVYRWLAECYRGLGDEEAAKQAQARAEELKNTTALDHFILGEFHYMCQDKSSDSMEDYNRALQTQTNHYLSLLAAGMTGSGSETVAVLTGAIAVNPNNTAAYLERGDLYFYRGEKELAKADIERAIQINPRNWYAYQLRAKCHTNTDLKIDTLNKASQMAHSFIPSIVQDRAIVYEAIGNYEAALADATRVIEFLEPRLRISKGLKNLRCRGGDNWSYLYTYIATCECRTRIYKKLGQTENATADVARMMQLTLTDPSYYRYRAKVLLRIGKHEEALMDIDESLRLDSHSSSGYELRSQIHMCKGNLDKALEDVTQALILSPMVPRAYYTRALIYSKKGQYSRAIEECAMAISRAPKEVAVYGLRGYVYLNIGDYDRAIADFEEIIRLAPNETSAYSSRAMVYTAKGDLDRALEDFEKAIQLDPKNAHAYFSRGNAYSDKGDLEEALTDYGKAIINDPKSVGAYNNRGCVYSENGDLEHALADFEKAIQVDPKCSTAYSNRGNIYRDKGNLDQALADYNKAVELDPQDVRFYAGRGNLYARMGDLERAKDNFEKVIQLDPKEPWIIAPLAELLVTCPDPQFQYTERAVALAQRAVELAPKYSASWRALGIAQYRAGKWDEALLALNKHVELYSGGSPTTWIFLAMTHWQIDHQEEAWQWYDKAVAWMEERKSKDVDLLDLRAEADALFGKAENNKASSNIENFTPGSEVVTEQK